MGEDLDEISAGKWWGEAFTKVAVGLLSLAASGMAVWTLSIHTQLATLNVKLDHMATSSAELKAAVIDATAIARDNARRLDRLEATRFTDSDLIPLEKRAQALEGRRR